jgi:hypothetical protein
MGRRPRIKSNAAETWLAAVPAGRRATVNRSKHLLSKTTDLQVERLLNEIADAKAAILRFRDEADLADLRAAQVLTWWQRMFPFVSAKHRRHLDSANYWLKRAVDECDRHRRRCNDLLGMLIPHRTRLIQLRNRGFLVLKAEAQVTLSWFNPDGTFRGSYSYDE